jgi:hypothetical protein
MKDAHQVKILSYVDREDRTLFRDILVVARDHTILRGRSRRDGQVTDFASDPALQALLGGLDTAALVDGLNNRTGGNKLSGCWIKQRTMKPRDNAPVDAPAR